MGWIAWVLGIVVALIIIMIILRRARRNYKSSYTRLGQPVKKEGFGNWLKRCCGLGNKKY